MKRPASYNTRQREAVIEYIVSLGDVHITAAQIVSHFHNKEISVGRTTVYRNIDKLIRAGKLQKYNVDGISGACYRYVSDNEKPCKQLLLKCESCGEFIRPECDELNEMHEHIYRAHTFKVNIAKTIFYGKCESCLRTT